VDPEFASAQVGASAPVCPPCSTAAFDASDASSSPGDPPLETCMRELDAVLASLDSETS